MTITIRITDKRPTVEGAPIIVCGNSTYSIKFIFDAEWDAQAMKTARFVYVQDGKMKVKEKLFTGDTVPVPILSGTREVLVGVYAGNLQTSTPARIPCELSIRCHKGAPADPEPSVYDQLMSQVNSHDKRITNLEERQDPSLTETDESVAYIKDVPAGVLPFAEVAQIGGMTYRDGDALRSAPVAEVESVGANLWDEKAVSGYYASEDGAFTSAAGFLACKNKIKAAPNAVYYISCPIATALCFYDKQEKFLSYQTYGDSRTFTTPGNCYYIAFHTWSTYGATYNNDVIISKGEGAVPYSPHTRNSLLIPEAVQALDGYGEGVNESVYNYIDYEKKQFVKRVGKVVFDGSADENWNVIQYTNLCAFLSSEEFGHIPNRVLCDRFDAFGNMSGQPNGTVGIAVEGLSVNASTFFFGVSGIATNVTEWQAYLAANPVTVYYELATPEVTDISEILPADNYIGVEVGGVLTFVNEHAAAVPSTITYALRGE